MNHEHHDRRPAGGSRGKIALAVFLAIAAFFLFSEHRAHAFGLLPYLLLIACPLMHLFHHGGHGGHGGHAPRDEQADADPRSAGGKESRS